MTTTDQIAAEIRESAARPSQEATGLPFDAYRDPGIHDLERTQIFLNDWVPVCAEGSLSETGDYVALDLVGEPIVVLRAQDGELRALSNVCRHRGTPFLEPGIGKNVRLVCPFHAWTYNDDGTLRAAPNTGCVKVEGDDYDLPKFAVDVWGGIVFVHLGENPEPLSSKLAGLDKELEAFDLQRFDELLVAEGPETWDCNWKIAVENGIENYHTFKVHQKSIGSTIPTDATTYENGGTGWSVTSVKRFPPLSDEASSKFSDFARDNYIVFGITPCFVGLLAAESWGFLIAHPLTSEKCLITSGLYVAKGETQDFLESPLGLNPTFVEEDKYACEQLQRGLRSKFDTPGPLVEAELVLHDFQAYLAERLSSQAS